MGRRLLKTLYKTSLDIHLSQEFIKAKIFCNQIQGEYFYNCFNSVIISEEISIRTLPVHRQITKPHKILVPYYRPIYFISIELKRKLYSKLILESFIRRISDLLDANILVILYYRNFLCLGFFIGNLYITQWYKETEYKLELSRFDWNKMYGDRYWKKLICKIIGFTDNELAWHGNIDLIYGLLGNKNEIIKLIKNPLRFLHLYPHKKKKFTNEKKKKPRIGPAHNTNTDNED